MVTEGTGYRVQQIRGIKERNLTRNERKCTPGLKEKVKAGKLTLTRRRLIRWRAERMD